MRAVFINRKLGAKNYYNKVTNCLNAFVPWIVSGLSQQMEKASSDSNADQFSSLSVILTVIKNEIT